MLGIAAVLRIPTFGGWVLVIGPVRRRPCGAPVGALVRPRMQVSRSVRFPTVYRADQRGRVGGPPDRGS